MVIFEENSRSNQNIICIEVRRFYREGLLLKMWLLSLRSISSVTKFYSKFFFWDFLETNNFRQIFFFWANIALKKYDKNERHLFMFCKTYGWLINTDVLTCQMWLQVMELLGMLINQNMYINKTHNMWKFYFRHEYSSIMYENTQKTQ